MNSNRWYFLLFVICGCANFQNTIEHSVERVEYVDSTSVVACDFVEYPNCDDPVYKTMVFSNDSTRSGYSKPRILIENSRSVKIMFCDGLFYASILIDKNNVTHINNRTFHVIHKQEMLQLISIDGKISITYYGLKKEGNRHILGSEVSVSKVFEGVLESSCSH